MTSAKTKPAGAVEATVLPTQVSPASLPNPWPLPDPWPAPTATGPLVAKVAVPASKSLTARYLVLAAQACGMSTLRGALKSRDTDLMVAGLRALGATITPDAAGTLSVQGALAPPTQGSLNVGLAGTVLRFLPPLVAAAGGTVRFDGDVAVRSRPIKPLLDALQRLGAAVSYEGQAGFAPFTVGPNPPLPGGAVTLDATASSQFLSALLLAGPGFGAGLDVTLDPPTVPSGPHVDMTLEALTLFGATTQQMAPNRFQVHPGGLEARDLTLETDLSNAGTFLGAALVTGGSVTVPNWPQHTTQPGDHLRHLLSLMGATVSLSGGALTVTSHGHIKPIEANLSKVGELTPVLAALALLADGPSRLTGIGHLRGHETDRLAALATEIARLGGQASQLPDGLVITPGTLKPATVETYGDHRMAGFAALVGLRVPGLLVRNIATTSKTMPQFPTLWQEMVAQVG